MATKIKIPESFDFGHTISFCKYLDETPIDLDYVLDFGAMSTIEPFGLLIIGSRLRRLIKEKEGYSNFKSINFKGNDYAAHMGFYKSVFLDYGKSPGEAKGSSTYIPITEISVSEIREESRHKTEHIVDTVERRANQIARVLSCHNAGVEKTLTYSIREIMRNVVEHSEAESVWFCGQYWQSKDRVEIAILDEGIGVFNSLKRNRKLALKGMDDSLYLAIEPGISGKNIKIERMRDEIYGNSGYGLYMTSRICEEGGDFVIGSGDKLLGLHKRGNKIMGGSINGTAIRLRLRASKIQDLSKMLSQFLKEGEQRSKLHSKSGVLSASKSSRLLLNTE